jgi:pyruvate, water dikinase
MGQTTSKAGFPSPFEIATPPGAEGWQRLYPSYYLFGEGRRAFEEKKFWFWDGMHNPEPVYPFDTIMTESWLVALNQYTTRVWLIPPALGIDHRIVNGYFYISPNGVSDPREIEERAVYFKRRAGYYFDNWDRLYEQWIVKAEDCIGRLKQIEFRPLPTIEDERVVTEGRGLTSSYDMLTAYSRLLENMHEMAYYHFEMLNLGYVAYLTLRDFCQKAFPGIQDETIAKMVAGIEILFFRPDDELRKLSALALDLGVAHVLERGDRAPEAILAEMRSAPNGEKWITAFEHAQEPWFWYSTGPGYCHQHRAWRDDLTMPFKAMQGYVERLERGENIARPLDKLREERERIKDEYFQLLGTEEDRRAFSSMIALARKVFVYVENHNFYVEHWHHSIFWNKVRDLGRVFAEAGFLADGEDIFYLHRYEIYGLLYDYLASWATSTPAHGTGYWPGEIRDRKRILEALRAWAPPPALGVPPEVVNEPFTVMLWGITTDTVQKWLAALGDGGGAGEGKGELQGLAASPGRAEGVARVITSLDQLRDVQTGDILVCPITAPSWAPVFSRIQATVTDIGGIMSHAAIICREYGLPAVVGTGFGTKSIKTGQRIRVDGNRGTVTVLD